VSVRGASDFLDGLGRQPESLPAASDRAVHDPVDLLERLEAGVCTFRVHVASVCAHWVRSAVVRARFGLARRVSVHPGFGLCPSACASRAPPEGIMALRVRTAGIRASRVRPLSICDFRVRGVSIQGRFSRLDGQGPNPRCADGRNPNPRCATDGIRTRNAPWTGADPGLRCWTCAALELGCRPFTCFFLGHQVAPCHPTQHAARQRVGTQIAGRACPDKTTRQASARWYCRIGTPHRRGGLRD